MSSQHDVTQKREQALLHVSINNGIVGKDMEVVYPVYTALMRPILEYWVHFCCPDYEKGC